MSGSLFSPAAPTPEPQGATQPAAAQPPANDNQPAPRPDVILPSGGQADSGLPQDVLMTPEEQALLGQQPPGAGQPAPQPGQEGDPAQPPPQGQQQGNPADRAPPGYVPAGSLAEARAELKAQRQAMQQMQSQMQAFLGAAAAAGLRLPGQSAPEPQPQLPDVNENPVAYFEARAAQLERELQRMREGVGQMTQAQVQQQQQAQFVEAYQAQATQYAAQNPEFVPAYQAWFSGLVQEAQAAGLPPQEALGWARQQEMAVAARAMQQEVNPAERILAMAKVRGWRMPPAANDNQPLPQGQAPANDNRPYDPAAAFGALERGAAASRSVGANGVPPAAGLTAERIASMPMADFERATDGDAWERLWRGG